MFNRSKKTNAPVSLKTDRGFSVLIQQKVLSLKGLASLSASDFDQLYVTAIERLSQYLHLTQTEHDEQILLDLLDNLTDVLKERQGRLLPPGADSETVFRQQSVWTFAIFVAGLMTVVPHPLRWPMVTVVLSHDALLWLQRYDTLFQSWRQFLQEEGATNIFRDLLLPRLLNKQDEVLIEMTPLPSAEVVINTTQTTALLDKAETTQPIELTESTQPSESTSKTIPSVDLRELAASDGSLDSSRDLLAQRPPKQPALTSQHFWRWLSAGLAEQRLSMNEINSVLHGVADGILICLPAALTAFLTDQGEQNSDATLLADQRRRLLKAIKKHPDSVRDANGSRIHTYCIGRWEDRNTRAGIVIAAEALLGKGQVLSINPELKPDPISMPA